MEFWTAVAVLRRRWYVFVPTLMVFALLAAFLVSQVKPTYKAAGTMILLQTGTKDGSSPSATTTTTSGSTTDTDKEIQEAGNPYLQMDKIQFANVMAQIAIDSNFKDALVADGGSPTYEVLPPYGNSPTLTLSASAPTEAEAMASYRKVVEHLKKMVVDRQVEVDAPASTVYTGVELNVPTMAFPQNGARTKGVIVVAAIGFLVAVGLSFIVDSMLAARARRRQDEEDEQAGELVTLISAPRSPLDDLADLDDLDDLDDPDPKAGGSGGSMRW